MPPTIRPTSYANRRIGQPIEPSYGSDWLSNLPRFHEAEQGGDAAVGRVLLPPKTADTGEFGEADDEQEPASAPSQPQAALRRARSRLRDISSAD